MEVFLKIARSILILLFPSEIETTVNLLRHFHGNFEDGFGLQNKSKSNLTNIFRNFKTPTANLLQNPEKHAVSVQSNKCFLIEAKRSTQLIVE